MEEDVKRNTYATFGKYIDLKKACRDWNRSTATTWDEMKNNFSKEIQINKTDPAVLQRQEQANAVLN